MKARLASDGSRILCRMIDCGAVLGAVHDEYPDMPASDRDDYRQPFPVLRPGYRRGSDGVFRVTPAAEKRRRHGQKMRVGGRMSSERPHDPIAAVEMGVRPCCPGRRVKCFACGQVQTLDETELMCRIREHRALVSRAGAGGIEHISYGPDDHADHPSHWHERYWRRPE